MKVGISSLGCKVNLYESEYMADLFKKAGYEIVDFNDFADIYVINTCSVTNTSDVKSKKVIRQAIKRNKEACVCAVGCFIEANHDYSTPGLSVIVGNSNKSKIVSYVEEYFKKKVPLNKTTDKVTDTFEDMEMNKFAGRTRAFIKIQDGCENFCTYCIIPYVRGKCRSKEFATVIKEITDYVNNGFKEVVLTGIHTGNYGVDINSSFADLLEEIVKIKGLFRLRISSIEITELNDKVLNIIKNNSVIVDHLHIPLQSGSEKILSLMNRKYDKKYFLDKVNQIRRIRPNISLTTDVIVGFPNETESDFIECKDFIKEIKFSKIHVFPYSKRNGTVASTMENQVDDITKKDRVKRLLALSKELEINYMNKFINKRQQVLVEVSRDDYSLGHTSNYLLVKIPGIYKSEDIKEVEIDSIEYPYCNCKSVK